MNTLEKLSLIGLIPEICLESAADVVPVCKALREGGLPAAEITWNAAAGQALREVSRALPGFLTGVSGVKTAEEAERAAQAGAAWIVTNGVCAEAARCGTEQGIPVLPACRDAGDVARAQALGLAAVKLMAGIVCPDGAELSLVRSGDVTAENLVQVLAAPGVCAAGADWLAPGEAIRKQDWAGIAARTRAAVKRMLGLELMHLGFNPQSEEGARQTAAMLSLATGLPAEDRVRSIFVGEEYEIIRPPVRGAHGHIALGVNHLPRARWHLEQRGLAFDDSSATIRNGQLMLVYLRDEIGGFAVHLLQR